ncbi:MAG: hypothetical protein QOJ51_1812 [Acidobacteriaceae bacterium]|jgi:hypothetical protein|nr:hypothetical protein [Acidobacteriaceae bacterium]MDX6459735.1 hypothetical protein [Acidobacteriaceae bacterium]MEA2258987.1 hypothetical protein [Acidobacteriaceae bacterium]
MRQEIAEAKAKWLELVSEQHQSGQSVAAFCSERGLRAWQFYEWKKRLRESEAVIIYTPMMRVIGLWRTQPISNR